MVFQNREVFPLIIYFKIRYLIQKSLTALSLPTLASLRLCERYLFFRNIFLSRLCAFVGNTSFDF
jgi:hypothetical protein